MNSAESTILPIRESDSRPHQVGRCCLYFWVTIIVIVMVVILIIISPLLLLILIIGLIAYCIYGIVRITVGCITCEIWDAAPNPGCC